MKEYAILQPETVDKLQRHPVLNICTAICAAILAITVLIIALQYDPDTSPCAIGVHIIDLPFFLYVIGAVGLIISGLTFLFALLTICEKDQEVRRNLVRVSHGARVPVCCTVIFNLVWAGVGLCEYNLHMNEECKQSAIGITVFTWSLVMYCVVFSVGCCLCGMLSCLCCAEIADPH